MAKKYWSQATKSCDMEYLFSGMAEVVEMNDTSKKTTLNSVEPNIYQGRKKITIPVSADMLDEFIIQKYLPNILAIHEYNVMQSDNLINYRKGVQDILRKVRANKDKSNNVIVENFAQDINDFKTSFMFGDPIRYSSENTADCTKDITELTKFLRGEDKATKDVELGEQMYTIGQAIRMILPRENNSTSRVPFNIYNLDYHNGFIVYSSNYRKEKLFGGVVNRVDRNLDGFEESVEVTIYTRDHIYTYANQGSGGWS